MSDRFVTVGRLSALSEALIVKSELEAEGVPAWIIEDAVGGSLPGLGDTVGAIRLQIREADQDRADAVLARLLGDGEEEAGFEEARTWTCTFCDEQVHGDFDACPSCGVARQSVVTRPQPPAQAVALPAAPGDEDPPETTMERSTAELVTSRPCASSLSPCWLDRRWSRLPWARWCSLFGWSAGCSVPCGKPSAKSVDPAIVPALPGAEVMRSGATR